jgi:hypothetical protein
MEYWSVGVMEKGNLICFCPILQYSNTPSVLHHGRPVEIKDA